jgi:hypothetical protein
MPGKPDASHMRAAGIPGTISVNPTRGTKNELSEVFEPRCRKCELNPGKQHPRLTRMLDPRHYKSKSNPGNKKRTW